MHGNSRVVVALLLKAAETKQFNVMVTEGRPNEDRYVSTYDPMDFVVLLV